MANEEINYGYPMSNKWSVPPSSETLNPAPNEAALNAQMNMQLNDTLVSDADFRIKGEIHKDETANTPKGASLVGTEKPVNEGSLHEKMTGGKPGKSTDFTKG